MAQASRVEPQRSDLAVPDARVREIVRRIEQLEALPESAFGRFTRWDWLCCALISVVLPAAALFWFGR